MERGGPSFQGVWRGVAYFQGVWNREGPSLQGVVAYFQGRGVASFQGFFERVVFGREWYVA